MEKITDLFLLQTGILKDIGELGFSSQIIHIGFSDSDGLCCGTKLKTTGQNVQLRQNNFDLVSCSKCLEKGLKIFEKLEER